MRLGGANATRARRVVFVSDVGFQYGAGIATRRQVQSLLLLGSQVGLVCWSAGRPAYYDSVRKAPGWLGAMELLDAHAQHGASLDMIVERVTAAIMEKSPDLVIFGGLHGAGWPLALMKAVQSRGAAVVCYLHDLHWITGRCAYNGSCEKFTVLCDEHCPSPTEYPAAAPETIAAAWHERRDVFTGPDAIPLVANSNWTAAQATKRFSGAAKVDVVYLGSDCRLFAPIERVVARRLLELPEDRPLVLLGAVNVTDARKGGPLFQAVLEALTARDDLTVAVFGHGSELLPNCRGWGLVHDERLMPLLFSAADLFVGTATEEAFGQTLVEAGACGTPVVAFDVGGISEIVVHRSTGLLSTQISASALLSCLDDLLRDGASRDAFGVNARQRVVDRYSLEAQARAWARYLDGMPKKQDAGF